MNKIDYKELTTILIEMLTDIQKTSVVIQDLNDYGYTKEELEEIGFTENEIENAFEDKNFPYLILCK